MLDLPEITVIARQMQKELAGKRIAAAVCNASPHKFAFYNHPAEAYLALLAGRTIAGVGDNGFNFVSAMLDSGAALQIGEMGGRIIYYPDAGKIPAKHQLLLSFDDGSALAVSIVLWGFIRVVSRDELAAQVNRRISPICPEFTWEYFSQLFADPVEAETRSVKAFMISKPGIGIGNGPLQDILFRAHLAPRRRMITLRADEQRDLYDATCETLNLMVEGGGRDSERDLYNQPGRYHCILGSQVAGRPCPDCGTPIEKISFLGGASYYCPTCQR